MFKHQPWLHIRCKEDAKKIKLEQPPNVIKVDWINYVLQTGAGSNQRLHHQRGRASSTDGRSVRSVGEEPWSSAAKAPEHCIPFEGDALRKSPDVDVQDKRPVTRRRTLEAQASADASELGETPMGVSTSSEAGDEDDADVLAVLQQNRALTHDAVPAGGTVTNGGGTASMLAMKEARGRSATTFRPTTLKQQIYNVIGHTDNQGKDAQCILECTQARESRIREASPVLRGAFDFGFHVRGLSVMHFERVRRATPLDASGSVINMTDFSRKNGLQSATTDPS
ncbi:uncharacterized protein PITG_22524 [Phytophthora infestans T30-4]|uniref:Uncharacterized protein n=1 Tax=Phytophthora infestans (strain T30-4) TaxID=403677 RepID=D0RMG2_PHYIT|nr:uncharacterized protein PITG_22524 [Phytophthora infestans T30-4]EEY63142.1 conserved hypothetical protein [Phytophthora infestans T30-4]|eukprot:XP_002909768.1 conserved hypothetical protein [Phytophthora infestans T30-4]